MDLNKRKLQIQFGVNTNRSGAFECSLSAGGTIYQHLLDHPKMKNHFFDFQKVYSEKRIRKSWEILDLQTPFYCMDN